MTSKNHDVLQKDEISRRWQRLLSNTRSASNLLLATGLMSLGEEGLLWQQGVSLSSETRQTTWKTQRLQPCKEMICSFCYCLRNESYGLNYSLEYSTMVFYWLHLDFFLLAEIRQCMMIITVNKILKESRKFCPVCFPRAHKLFIRSLLL